MVELWGGKSMLMLNNKGKESWKQVIKQELCNVPYSARKSERKAVLIFCRHLNYVNAFNQ